MNKELLGNKLNDTIFLSKAYQTKAKDLLHISSRKENLLYIILGNLLINGRHDKFTQIYKSKKTKPEYTIINNWNRSPEKPIIDILLENKLINESPAIYEPESGRNISATRFKPTEKLYESLGIQCNNRNYEFKLSRHIALKGTVTNLYNKQTVISTIHGINLINLNADIVTPYCDAYAPLQANFNEKEKVKISNTKYKRKRTGRVYTYKTTKDRNYQQNKKVRAEITINNNRTVELDFKSSHPHILYALHGKQLKGDPYTVIFNGKKELREFGKSMFNIMLNCQSQKKAVKTMVSWFFGYLSKNKNKWIEGKGKEFIEANQEHSIQIFGKPFNQLTPKEAHPILKKWIKKMKKAHPKVKSQFFKSGTVAVNGKDIGIMQVEARVLHHVLYTFRNKETEREIPGIPILPLHDSFIVEEDNIDFLNKTMLAAYSLVIRNNLETLYKGTNKGRKLGQKDFKIKIERKDKS